MSNMLRLITANGSGKALLMVMIETSFVDSRVTGEKEEMSGTKSRGLKARDTNIERHGADFYREIGRRGGKNGHAGGFASDKVGADGLTGFERAKKVGALGGAKSRRGPAKKNVESK